MFWVLLYQIGYFLATSIPLKTGYKIAEFIADIKYAISKKDRTCVINNLKVILQDDSRNVTPYAKEVFKNFSKYLIEFFRILKIDRDYISRNIKIVGLENLNNALAKKRGVLVLGAHIGNWELGAVVLGMLGYPVNIIALDHKIKWVNDFFIRQRASKGVRVFSPRSALKKCFMALRNNEIIGILGDREFYNQGIDIDFLGKTTYVPKSPAIISLRANAPIVTCFPIRESDNSFSIYFELPIEYAPSGSNTEQDVKTLTERYTAIIEKYIRKYPAQWFVFQEFWQKNRNREII